MCRCYEMDNWGDRISRAAPGQSVPGSRVRGHWTAGPLWTSRPRHDASVTDAGQTAGRTVGVEGGRDGDRKMDRRNGGGGTKEPSSEVWDELCGESLVRGTAHQ